MVYVDPLMRYGGSATFKWKDSCHLFADTVEELHIFASLVGMRREWFQDKPSLKHYDLNARRRIVAVARGAIELNRYDAVMKWRQLRSFNGPANEHDAAIPREVRLRAAATGSDPS